MKQNVQYANVDLELECGSDLQPLLNDLGPDFSIHYHDRLGNGNDFASLALRLDKVESGIYGEPNKTISEFCDLIERIPLKSKNIWNHCERRAFDIGFESGNIGKAYAASLENATLARVAELGATIEITIYAVPRD